MFLIVFFQSIIFIFLVLFSYFLFLFFVYLLDYLDFENQYIDLFLALFIAISFIILYAYFSFNVVGGIL